MIVSVVLTLLFTPAMLNANPSGALSEIPLQHCPAAMAGLCRSYASARIRR